LLQETKSARLEQDARFFGTLYDLQRGQHGSIETPEHFSVKTNILVGSAGTRVVIKCGSLSMFYWCVERF
jgi:hypothetical protein